MILDKKKLIGELNEAQQIRSQLKRRLAKFGASPSYQGRVTTRPPCWGVPPTVSATCASGLAIIVASCECNSTARS